MMNQGAAVGVSPGEQCPQHQEAERERQAVGQGAYGGRRGRVHGLGLAATTWAQGGPLSPVAKSCPTLRDPMDCSPPGSSARGIFQARVLEWDAIAFSDLDWYT